MQDDLLPQNDGKQAPAEDVELFELSDPQLISKLDSLKTSEHLNKKYSEIYMGGVYALKEKNRRENPDWMAQSANSFREILYILKKTEAKEVELLLNEHFGKSLTPQEVNEYRSYMTSLYGLFSDLTHHFSGVPDIALQKYRIDKNLEIGVNPLTKEDYFAAIKLYKEYLKLFVITALDMHKKIDECIAQKKQDKDLVHIFFDNSKDSKIYFLSQADETWLQWLWTNCFFVDLKKPAEDPTQYGYRMPELDYLTKMASKDPKTVAAIINSIPVSQATFNPEVIDRFTWISGELSGEYVKTLVPKMIKENWSQLMAPFSRSGFTYERIVKSLKNAKEYEALIQLAEAMLANRSKEELDEIGFSASGKIFYLNDITETEIFQSLLDPENPHKEKTLEVFLGIFARVVCLGKDRQESAFAESEPFYLSDVDLFEHKLNLTRHSYSKDDIENVIAACIELVGELFTNRCEDEAEVRRIYETYVEPLPDSYTVYRLKLFAVSSCPKVFGKELQELLLRMFSVGERYSDIEYGAEYHHTLIKCFSELSSEFQRDYVEKTFEYFAADLEDENKKKWRLRDGLEIITYIKESLTPEELEKSKALFGAFPEEGSIKPHARSSGVTSGFVSHRSPVDVSKFSVDEIIEHLKTDWSPAVFKEKYKEEDFLSPRGSEGLADELQKDFKLRSDEYFSRLETFFDRENIDPSYLYALLSEIDMMLRNKQELTAEQHVILLKLLDTIRQSGETEGFQKGEESSYRADWITVHKMATDIFLNVLDQIKDSEIFKSNRPAIIATVSYLLSIKNSPSPEHDKPEQGEPAHIALNSVRGQAVRVLVQISYNDGSALEPDVKAILENVLNTDSSPAVRFTIGQFFASFYFRDEEYIKSILPQIFPKGEAGKEELYFATWEGYLSSALYIELFKEMEEYYVYAISVDSEEYPDRKNIEQLDELLAGHMALAYAEIGMKVGDPLFETFWNTPNEKRHYEFAAFLGRHYLSRSGAEEWIKDRKVDKQKLLDFWSWVLKTDFAIEAKVYSGFGFWINPDQEILDDKSILERMPETLKKSEGLIDWEYGLLKHIDQLAELDPEKTFDIITSLLILDGELNPNHKMYFDAANQISAPLKIIYKEVGLKKRVEDLVNLLIEKGSSSFWSLKDILD